MNDFTKEELVLIACWSANRCNQVGEDQALDEGTISLSHKIQSIIVNYCEHDFVCSYREKGYDVCQKCGEEL